MQVKQENTQNIFEFIQYIDCSVKSSSVVHKKNVTSTIHNIKNTLKNKIIIPHSRNDMSSLI